MSYALKKIEYEDAPTPETIIQCYVDPTVVLHKEQNYKLNPIPGIIGLWYSRPPLQLKLTARIMRFPYTPMGKLVKRYCGSDFALYRPEFADVTAEQLHSMYRSPCKTCSGPIPWPGFFISFCSVECRYPKQGTYICTKCNEEKPRRVIAEGRIRLIRNTKICYDCIPYGCKEVLLWIDPSCSCGVTDLQKFNKNNYARCKRCVNASKKMKIRSHRKRALKYLGGECIICGYNDQSRAIDIHHVDPSIKDPNAKKMYNWKWERLKLELDKCVLLCRVCHAEHHGGYIKVPPGERGFFRKIIRRIQIYLMHYLQSSLRAA